MNKTNKILVYSVLTIFILGLLFFFYRYFSNKDLVESFMDIRNLDNISYTEPLLGPSREEISESLISDEIVLLTNKQRENFGEQDLEINQKLTEAAKKKLEDMFINQYFEHVSPIDSTDISKYVMDEKYAYSYVGENLAMGDFGNEAEMVDAWMDSPGHKENILNKNYTEIGVAVKKGNIFDRNTWMAVQVFGQPSKNCELPDSSLYDDITKTKSVLDNLSEKNDEIRRLQDESSKLIVEGNESIEKGNEIYKETKDISLAEDYWNNGEKLYNEGVSKNEEANKIIDEINSYESQSQELQIMISKYNSQVEVYNKCIGG